jgi:DNA-binding transcriptional MerR regulator
MSAGAQSSVPRRASADSIRLSIGQVLEHLHDEFSELTPSKLRFLEEQGLIEPERTASGYRKFRQAHIERLRLILTLQRDHFLPLKVIAELLDEVDGGGDPVIPGTAHRAFSSILRPSRVLGSDELARVTGVTRGFIGDLISAGLIPTADVFPTDTIEQVRALKKLNESGITPRHLRQLRLAAERDAELIQRVSRSRGRKDSAPEAVEKAQQLASLLDTVRSGVVKSKVQSMHNA